MIKLTDTKEIEKVGPLHKVIFCRMHRHARFQKKFLSLAKCDGGDNFCLNQGTCSGINECMCQPGFLGRKCAYRKFEIVMYSFLQVRSA